MVTTAETSPLKAKLKLLRLTDGLRRVSGPSLRGVGGGGTTEMEAPGETDTPETSEVCAKNAKPGLRNESSLKPFSAGMRLPEVMWNFGSPERLTSDLPSLRKVMVAPTKSKLFTTTSGLPEE